MKFDHAAVLIKKNVCKAALTLVLSAMVCSSRTSTSRFSTTSAWKLCQFLVTSSCREDSRSSTDFTHRQAGFVSRYGSDTYKINLALRKTATTALSYSVCWKPCIRCSMANCTVPVHYVRVRGDKIADRHGGIKIVAIKKRKLEHFVNSLIGRDC
jgi:hypothetical protein